MQGDLGFISKVMHGVECWEYIKSINFTLIYPSKSLNLGVT